MLFNWGHFQSCCWFSFVNFRCTDKFLILVPKRFDLLSTCGSLDKLHLIWNTKLVITYCWTNCSIYNTYRMIFQFFSWFLFLGKVFPESFCDCHIRRNNFGQMVFGVFATFFGHSLVVVFYGRQNLYLLFRWKHLCLFIGHVRYVYKFRLVRPQKSS